jgi:hypothetical protein
MRTYLTLVAASMGISAIGCYSSEFCEYVTCVEGSGGTGGDAASSSSSSSSSMMTSSSTGVIRTTLRTIRLKLAASS